MRSKALVFLLALSVSCSPPQSDTATHIDLEQKAHELAQKILITDGHVDLPYRLNGHMEDVSVRTALGDFDYERAKEGGLDAPFMSIYVPADYQETGGAKEFADSMIAIVEGLVQSHPDKFAMAYSTTETMANFEKGLISFPMGMENGAPLENSLDNVKYFYERGIRYITLTHGKDNQICDSSYDTTRTWNGLSPFGSEVIAAMNRNGIMVDISHVSDSAFFQALEVSTAPAIASHSSCRYFTPGFERNMSDDMIHRLAENGGVVQINFGSTFIDSVSAKSSKAIGEHFKVWLNDHQLTAEDSTAQAYREQYINSNFTFTTLQKVVDHIDHVVSLVGVEHVAFGSDFDGVGNSLPTNLKDVSHYPNLIHELLIRGYSEEDIEKICYRNVFRVWDDVARIAEEMKKEI